MSIVDSVYLYTVGTVYTKRKEKSLRRKINS